VPPVPAPTLPVAVASPSPAAETPGPVVSASAAPTDPALAVRPGQFNIGDHRLVSDSVGWVSTPDAIYRTPDLGRTWSVVSPAGRPTGSSSRDLFIDPDTAYSFLPDSGTIAITHDAGVTWAETVLDGSRDGTPTYWFDTPQHGSLVFPGKQKWDPSPVFDTTDGGRTWAGPRPGPSQDSRWPFFNSFGTDGTRSVLARIGEPNAAIQISHDAGATWIDRPYPPIPEAYTGPDTRSPGILAVWGDTDGHIVLAISSIYHSRCVVICQDTLLYTSADDGRSWQYVATSAPMHLLDDSQSQFLSPTEWVLVSEAETADIGLPFAVATRLTFTSTVDGGAHWRTTTQSSPIPFVSWTASTTGGVDFATPDIGWAIASCDTAPTALNDFACDPVGNKAPRRTILVQTTDGGLTWSSIGE